MKEYKAIFIDWDDTIGDFQHAEHLALRDLYDKYNLKLLYPTFNAYYSVYHEHNIMLWDRYGKGLVTKDFLQFDRFYYPLVYFLDRDIAPKEQSILSSQATAMGDDFLVFTNKYFQLLPNAEQVVIYLASKYMLTILSNGFVEVQYKKIELSGLKGCFQFVVLSEEVGVPKPDVRIFEKALALSDLQPSEVLMIGDSYGSDIQGAINAGIDQLWINADKTDLRSSTYRVDNIIDILQML